MTAKTKCTFISIAVVLVRSWDDFWSEGEIRDLQEGIIIT
jgi:hypothetical protein